MVNTDATVATRNVFRGSGSAMERKIVWTARTNLKLVQSDTAELDHSSVRTRTALQQPQSVMGQMIVVMEVTRRNARTTVQHSNSNAKPAEGVY